MPFKKTKNARKPSLAVKLKKGRPTKYNERLASKICLKVSTTILGLPELCDLYAEFPLPETIYLWKLKYPDFSAKYNEAKLNQLQIIEDDMRRVARTPNFIEEITNEIEFGNKIVKKIVLKDNAALRKDILETDKWLMTRLSPKKYGDTTKIVGDPEQPLSLTIKTLNLDDISPKDFRPNY